ncbi:MAG: T9SS type A sorting domain-containing protein [Chitinophagales bacterium]|nr:T9SS type A sorting domain-containing protein [Chitinophagales bacterium]
MQKILILTTLFLFSFSLIYGQMQQHVWYLQDQEIDFTTDPPSISPISPEYGAGGSGGAINTGNGIHDAAGNKLLSVYNATVFSNSGVIGTLEHMDWEVDGADIIPKPGSPCGYYIVYSSTINSTCVDCEGYCGTGFSTYNKFYTEVDMSLNYGQGEIVGTNGIELSACTDWTPNPIAVTHEHPDETRFLFLLSNRQIKRYLVSSSGIAFEEVIGEYGLLTDVNAIELELSADGTKLACADFNGDRVLVFHLDPTTGTIDPTAGNNGDGTSDYLIPTISSSLTGVEFSLNGFNLFVGSRGEGIYHITIPTGAVEYLENSESYGNTQLELAYHPMGFGMHKIYGVSQFSPDKLGYIESVESISPSFVADAYDGISAYDDPYTGLSFTGINRLPNQIDGEFYLERFDDATGACCATINGFDGVEYIATTSETWTPFDNPFGDIASVSIAQELRIPNGVDIEILDMEFLFNEGAQVVIEQGGKLTLRNTTFTTSDCEGLLWKGVQVWGNSSEPQTYADQGWLFMFDSKIEHAHIGVDAWKPGSWGETGGVIMAYGSTFKNNRRAVNFMNYVHTVGDDIEVANKSLFRNVDFIWDNEFRALPLNHASLYKVTGVKFAGCHFSDDRTGDNFTRPFITGGNITKCGIRSIDAKYYVNAACNSMDPADCGEDFEAFPWNPSTFNNLDFGIYAANSSSIYPIDVKRSVFTNNLYGIHTDALNTPKLIWNRFYYNNINNRYTFYTKIGIRLLNTQNIFVEENDFLNTTGAGIGLCVGILCSQLGQNNEMVRKNNFEDLWVANLTEGENRGTIGPGYPSGSVGLSFECNTNKSNSTDFRVLDTFDDDFSFFNGIKINIGDFSQAAGNTFSVWTSSHFNNETSHILKYFWEAGPNFEPTLISGVTKIFTPNPSQCGSNIIGGGNLEGSFHQVQLQLEPLMQEYSQYVNQGITPPAQLEDQIIYLKGQKSQIANLIQANLYQEEDTSLDLNSVEQWLKLDEDFLYQMRLIDLYIQKLDFNSAMNEMNDLSNTAASYPQNIQQRISDFIQLKNIIIPALSQQNTLANLSESQKNAVRSLASNGSGIAKYQAQELMCFFFDECQSNVPSIGQSTQNAIAPDNNSILVLQNKQSALYPNPTTDIFTLSIEDIKGTYQIGIYTLQGHLVKKINTLESKTEINISDLENGIYLLKATNGKNSFTERIIKM